MSKNRRVRASIMILYHIWWDCTSNSEIYQDYSLSVLGQKLICTHTTLALLENGPSVMDRRFPCPSVGEVNYSRTHVAESIFSKQSIHACRTSRGDDHNRHFGGVIGRRAFAGLSDFQTLKIGENYLVTAKPSPGWFLENWTDGAGNILSQIASFHYTATDEQVLTANFVPNPFVWRKATTSGCFMTPPTASPPSPPARLR